MNYCEDISAVILSAGNSSRMNAPKALLMFDDQKTFIEKIIESYRAGNISNIIVVVNPQIKKNVEDIISRNNYSHYVKLIFNQFIEKGRFYSIKQGLIHSHSSFTFLQNIDNPFIPVELINKMIASADSLKYIVPVFKNKEGHPVLLNKMIVKYLISLKSDDYNLKNELSLFKKLRLNWPDKNILLNINTAEDYRQYVSTCKASIGY